MVNHGWSENGLLIVANNHENSTWQNSNLLPLIETGEVMVLVPHHKGISGWAENGLLMIQTNYEKSTVRNSNLANLIEEGEGMVSILYHKVNPRWMVNRLLVTIISSSVNNIENMPMPTKLKWKHFCYQSICVSACVSAWPYWTI